MHHFIVISLTKGDDVFSSNVKVIGGAYRIQISTQEAKSPLAGCIQFFDGLSNKVSGI